MLIVDDHAVVRSGLRLVLEAEEDLEPVGEAGTAREAIFEARSTKPDVILLDVVMPEQSGLEAIPTLLKESPEVKILVLSMQDDPQYVREAFAAGASGYVLKEAADSEVVHAVREVAAGGRYLHPELGARLVAAESEERKRAEEDPLSERESEVLTAARARPHQPGDRQAAVHLGAHGRDAPGARDAEAAALEPRGAASGTRSSVGCSSNLSRSAGSALLEQHEHAQLLVAGEPMLGAGGDEDRVALAELDRLAFDLQRAAALDHDVDLVVLVRLLAVGLGRDQHVDAQLEPGRAVDDLVAAAARPRAAARQPAMSNGCALVRRCWSLSPCSSMSILDPRRAKAARGRPSLCATEEALSLRCDSAA